MTQQDDNERRRFQRVAFAATTQLLAGDEGWSCQLVDISLKGALIELPAAATLEQNAEVALVLQLDDSVAIRMYAQIAHRNGDRVGLRCTRIDSESLTHLRRLLELNLGDPQLAERELSQLAD
jgi:hypothetical protein